MPHLLSWKTLTHHWALLPVVGICGAAVVMCGSYILHMATQKTDLSFSPRSWNTKNAPYQTVEPHEIKKFISHQHKHVFDPEIEALKREIGSYKS
jgi:hypothetical protein